MGVIMADATTAGLEYAGVVNGWVLDLGSTEIVILFHKSKC